MLTELMLAANLQRRFKSEFSQIHLEKLLSSARVKVSCFTLIIQEIAQQSSEIRQSGPPLWANPTYGVNHLFVGGWLPRKPTQPSCCEGTALTTAPGSSRRIRQFSVVSSPKIL